MRGKPDPGSILSDTQGRARGKPAGGRRACSARRDAVRPQRLLDFDVGAGFFELGFDLGRFVLGHSLLDRVGSTVDQVFGFFEAQAGDGADFFDDVDLLLAGSLEDDVEFGLLFDFLDGAAAAGPAATAIGMAAETPNSSSRAFTSWDSSRTVIFLISSIISCGVMF